MYVNLFSSSVSIAGCIMKFGELSLSNNSGQLQISSCSSANMTAKSVHCSFNTTILMNI